MSNPISPTSTREDLGLDGATCTNGYCDRPAVVACHPHTDRSLLLRRDHLTEPFVLDWRCLDCALDQVQAFIEAGA